MLLPDEFVDFLEAFYPCIPPGKWSWPIADMLRAIPFAPDMIIWISRLDHPFFQKEVGSRIHIDFERPTPVKSIMAFLPLW